MKPQPQPPLDSYLKLHSKANDKTTPSMFKRGIINAINIQARTVDIQIVGNQTTVLKGIAASSAINFTTVKAGDRCVVLLFSEINPNDSVILATY